MRRRIATLTATSLFVLVTTCGAAVLPIDANRFGRSKMTCHEPVRLTRDCSVRDGATRPVAFAGYRMNVASDTRGRTILIDTVRQAPDHNGRLFRVRRDRDEVAIAAIRALGRLLHREGICLERWRPVARGGRVEGFLLTLSDDGYAILRRYTVFESEHWLPRRLTRR